MIRVVYGNIERYNKTVIQNKEKITEKIDNLSAACNDLGTIWKGKDADMFLDNMENYLKKMRNIPSSMEKISKFVTMASAQYKEEDELYAKDLKREQLRYKC